MAHSTVMLVTEDVLRDQLAETIEAVNHNIKNVDTLNRLDHRRERKALALVIEQRINELYSENMKLDVEISGTVLNAERLSRRLLLVERRVRELEAQTFRTRWRALCAWCRMFVAELGGPFVYDDELDPRVTDELIEMYRPPASLPLVRQDARHAPQ